MDAPQEPESGKTSSGLQPNLVAGLSYLAGFVSGLVVFLTEKQNRFVRFHAMQSVMLSLAWAGLGVVVPLVPWIGNALSVLLNLTGCVLWLVAMIKAFQGDFYRLPILGDIAAKQVGL